MILPKDTPDAESVVRSLEIIASFGQFHAAFTQLPRSKAGECSFLGSAEIVKPATYDGNGMLLGRRAQSRPRSAKLFGSYRIIYAIVGTNVHSGGLE